MQDFKALVDQTRASYNTGITLDIKFRESQLKALLKLYEENAKALQRAVKLDLDKPSYECNFTEIFVLKNDVENTLANLKKWMRPDRPEKDLANILDDILIHHDPYGVILIIGSWNYPVQLTMLPLAGAIAAGNCCIVKPSEVSPNVAALISELIPKYLNTNCYKVVTGGKNETQSLLLNRFDYIFFTGAASIGKLIHAAANKYLTPVTLELGGKSPVYVDETADLKIAAKRIMWGKCINSGQTCIAPDYILCSKKIEIELIGHFRNALKDFYGDDVQKSPDYARIVNEDHFDRLVELMHAGKIKLGGRTDRSDRFISPTVITGCDPNNAIMRDEIFGPILPILNVDCMDDAIDFINAREKPLALYIFSQNRKVIDAFMKLTSSGGVTINDTIMHFACDALPFGGVGSSGMGAYHGKHTYDMFTHKKSTLVRDFNKLGDKILTVRYPPYSNLKLSILTHLLKSRKINLYKYLPYLLAFGLGFVVSNLRNKRNVH